MNSTTASATEAHSLPPEVAGPLIICSLVLICVVFVVVTQIMEGAWPTLLRLPTQLTTPWLSGEIPHPASMLQWLAAWGDREEPDRLLPQLVQ